MGSLWELMGLSISPYSENYTINTRKLIFNIMGSKRLFFVFPFVLKSIFYFFVLFHISYSRFFFFTIFNLFPLFQIQIKNIKKNSFYCRLTAWCFVYLFILFPFFFCLFTFNFMLVSNINGFLFQI